ncbi:DNA-binding protein K10 isoform X2 [Drosophila grimshawi]|uniref:GH12444 n=1 Tax=Drosophila grimshawi TaxID=7222 RepID=B4JJ80_DROGR|nr:DNA-binding protein K10 isoform X2 [Drosophila grimshawi]EDV99632.1 GH12444 [Drosophila grimshawi]
MASKGNHNFQQNRAMQQPQRSNLRAAIAPYRKPFRPRVQAQAANQMMYSSSQMPSDPLYIDFNNPTPAPPTKSATATGNSGSASGQADGGKKKPLKGKQVKGNKNHQQHQHQQQHPHNMQYPPQMQMQMHGNNGWIPRFHPPNSKRFDEPMPLPNRGRMGGGGGGGPSMRGNGRHMMGPMGPGPCPMGPRGVLGPNGGGPMPPYPPMRFPAPMPPMRCPMPPMGGPPPPPFMRRNGRGGLNHPPLPPPPLMGPHRMGPRMPPRSMPPGCPGPGPYSMGHMNGNMNGGKIKKPNPKLIKQAVKGKSTIKTLKNLVNQYPIDKPWVNDEIRAVHDAKLDIENRLKGNKDDDLFAQYRVQRDKFVSMYEAARETYLKQEAATVMAKDAKDKDNEKNANSNPNAAAKVGNTNDATIPQVQAKTKIKPN